MKTNRQKSLWLLDALLFIGFLVSFFLDLTGLPLHQWIGVFGGLLALLHLALHWKWVEAVSARFFGRTSGQARRYYLLDSLIMLGFTLIILNGLVISTWLDLSLSNYTAWKDFHVITSILTLVALVLKIGLHWRWVVRVSRQPIFAHPVSGTQSALVVRAETMSRRDFLRLMGVVSLAAVMATRSILNENQAVLVAAQASSETSSEDEDSQTFAQVESTSPSASTSSASAADCSVRCNKRCSYPGHCQKYRDSNGDNLCDLGQCA